MHQIRRMVRLGDLRRVRRGAFGTSPAPQTPVDHHLELLAATWPLVGDRAVIANWSAALLHGLPVWTADLDTVSVVRASGGHGQRSACVRARLATVPPDHVMLFGELRLTTRDRTTVDEARRLPFDRAVAVVDAALKAGSTQQTLLAASGSLGRAHGIAKAQRAIRFGAAASGSVGESLSRVFLERAGFPSPILQYEVVNQHGEVVAVCDFAWEAEGVIGEFDGAIKYKGVLRPGEPPERALLREKARESAIRDADWIVVRWTFEDLAHPEQLAVRIRNAFGQARRLRRSAA